MIPHLAPLRIAQHLKSMCQDLLPEFLYFTDSKGDGHLLYWTVSLKQHPWLGQLSQIRKFYAFSTHFGDIFYTT